MRKLDENKSNPKRTWKILLDDILRKSKNRDRLPDHFEISDTVVTDPVCIADKFNKYFSEIATTLDANLGQSGTNPLSYLNDVNPTELFHFIPVDELTINYIIINLNNTGASADGLSSKIIKRLIPFISPYLVHLFNLCLHEGIFPTTFKKACVVPIFKSGNPFSFGNYRPISLLPILSKILEKVVYFQLLDFLTSQNFLFPYQFGFRQKHSTYMPIALLYDKITLALSKNKVCAAIYLDFSKAFDTVNPTILLSKLSKYGIQNSTQNCLIVFD